MNEADDSRDERDIMTVAELAACLNVQPTPSIEPCRGFLT